MLHLHRSERADTLTASLADLLADPGSADPFAPEVIAVPTRGVERWLAQRLSHRLGAAADETGICANVAFPSPGRLVREALAGVAGAEAEEDPWHPDRLVWPLLSTIDEVLAEPWAAPLARHLGAEDDDVRRGRRLALARRLARLYASYGSQRPDLLLHWASGPGTPNDPGAPGEPAREGIPEDLAWQARLWRRLRTRIGVPGLAERLPALLAALRERPQAAGLPGRLSVFGPTRLPEDQLRVLAALAEAREVHLWLPHPSPALWERAAMAPEAGSARRADQPVLARHPLLASMARDAVELQRRLAPLAGVVRHHLAPEPPPGRILGALQQALREDAPDRAPVLLHPEDRSVQVHACHGLARQVEVLREILLGLLHDDPTLEPRDVIVMCPDVEAVAPLITATFGLAAPAGPDGAEEKATHPGHRLRIRLADRGRGATNPLLALLADLVRLAGSRVTASEVLDLAARSPVRRRFALTDEDLDRLRRWSAEAGVRWGEDERRRARFGLEGLRQGTWDTALDRLLLGAAMTEDGFRYVGSALPVDDVDSTDVELAGRLAELLARLADVLAALDGAQPLSAWTAVLHRALDLLTDTTAEDAWQLDQARRLLTEVEDSAAGHDATLRLADVSTLLAERLRPRPTRTGFRTGALTVCSLEPMRAVPHRVVVLLGLDDGAFPRGGARDGDDLLSRDPRLGERDRRSEDRQAFLDALTAAEENLILLYSGADERTGSPRPPAVPAGELLDALDALARTEDGRSVREHVLVRHPLQPVDERCFTPGALGRPGPFSFDADAHRAALAGRGERHGPRPFLPGPLPAPEAAAELDLGDLVAALEHPVRWFLRHRLRISLPAETHDVADRLPLETDPLTRWAAGDRLLAARLSGVEPRHALNAEWRRGRLPPRELGRAVLLEVDARVAPVAATTAERAAGPARAVDVTAPLADGRVLTGTVPAVHGETVLRAVYSRLGPQHRLRAWTQLLALAVAHPGRPWTAVTIGRPRHDRPGALVSVLATPPQEEARRHLTDLAALRDLAACEPLPLPAGAAHAYARGRLAGDSPDMALRSASQEWEAGYDQPRADRARPGDAHLALCWGRDVPLTRIAGVPRAGERERWPDELTRLGVLARRLWQPLLTHESTEQA